MTDNPERIIFNGLPNQPGNAPLHFVIAHTQTVSVPRSFLAFSTDGQCFSSRCVYVKIKADYKAIVFLPLVS